MVCLPGKGDPSASGANLINHSTSSSSKTL
jgi:hypothetical protein